MLVSVHCWSSLSHTAFLFVTLRYATLRVSSIFRIFGFRLLPYNRPSHRRLSVVIHNSNRLCCSFVVDVDDFVVECLFTYIHPPRRVLSNIMIYLKHRNLVLCEFG